MPKKKFTGEQIAVAPRQAEAGPRAGGICRKMGVAEATSCRGSETEPNVHAGMGVEPSCAIGSGPRTDEMRRLKQLEEENGKLERPVADLTPDKSMMQNALRA